MYGAFNIDYILYQYVSNLILQPSYSDTTMQGVRVPGAYKMICLLMLTFWYCVELFLFKIGGG